LLLNGKRSFSDFLGTIYLPKSRIHARVFGKEIYANIVILLRRFGFIADGQIALGDIMRIFSL
jgi:hypothetical protein